MFQKATKSQAKLRMALDGPSGSGKTYTALAIAKHLGQKIALIDTERGSASKYADLFEFDTCDLPSFAPANYVAALQAAGKAGYDVVIIDSLTHAWSGQGGCLDQVDSAAAINRGNTYVAWRKVTPEHNKLVDAILQAPFHVIGTMRTKTEYVMEANERGKQTPRKVGLAPIQRDGMEYEFDVVADLDLDHRLMISKTRCAALDKYVQERDGEKVAGILKAWLSDGEPSKPIVRSETEESAPKFPEDLKDKARAALDQTALRAVYEEGRLVIPKELHTSWQSFCRSLPAYGKVAQ